MSNTGQGRYPHNSAWAFASDQGRARNSGSMSFLRTRVSDIRNNPTMWQDFFLGSDGITTGFGILKRWTGTSWITNTSFKVYRF